MLVSKSMEHTRQLKHSRSQYQSVERLACEPGDQTTSGCDIGRLLSKASKWWSGEKHLFAWSSENCMLKSVRLHEAAKIWSGKVRLCVINCYSEQCLKWQRSSEAVNRTACNGEQCVRWRTLHEAVNDSMKRWRLHKAVKSNIICQDADQGVPHPAATERGGVPDSPALHDTGQWSSQCLVAPECVLQSFAPYQTA